MAERRLTLSPDELATIVVHYPGLASTVHAQVRLLIQEAGFDAHLTKPVSAEELAEILSRA